MSVMLNMLKNKEVLSMVECIVFDYLIENKMLFKDFSVEKIVEVVYIFLVLVVRMCKKLGYNGFKDFKIDFIFVNFKVEIFEISEYIDVILIKD